MKKAKPSIYFIHTPKTGGTSVKAYANLTRHSRHPIRVPLLPWMGVSIAKTHLTVNQNLEVFGQDFYHKYDRIAGFVRDPYTRFLSSVAEFRRIFSDVPESQMDIPAMLERFTEGRFLAECRFALFHPQWRFFYHPHYWFNPDERHSPLSFRKGGYKVADRIFKYENYDKSFASLLEFFELEPVKSDKTETRYRSTTMDEAEKKFFYDEILTAKAGSALWPARRKFYRLYTKDFLLFGYKCKSNPLSAVMGDIGITEKIEIAHDPFWQRLIRTNSQLREEFLKGANRILKISLDYDPAVPPMQWPRVKN